MRAATEQKLLLATLLLAPASDHCAGVVAAAAAAAGAHHIRMNLTALIKLSAMAGAQRLRLQNAIRACDGDASRVDKAAVACCTAGVRVGESAFCDLQIPSSCLGVCEREREAKREQMMQG